MSIPESTVKRQNHPITLGELFELDEHRLPKMFNSEDDRNSTSLEYRIPEHQRYPSWTPDKKQKLIDSVFRNYTMSGFVVSEHIDLLRGEKYYDFEDGQTRLTILQSFYNNKLMFNELYYDDLSHVQQQRFNRYKISLEILSKSNPDDIQIMFERLQEGKPLSDEDKYWNRKNKKLVKFVHDSLELNSIIINNIYMSPQGYGDKKRGRLGHLCGFISGIINGPDYITSCFGVQCLGRNSDRQDFPNGMLDLEITPERFTKIVNFFKFYYDLIDTVYTVLPIRNVDDEDPIWNYLQTDDDTSEYFNRREQMKKWYSLSASEGGMILWDYLDQSDAARTLSVKKDMWVEIINIGRISENFITKSKSLYNGLSPADKQNTHSDNYNTRITRIKEFYAADDRGLYSEPKGIEWNSF
jgi:hypothetical protein